MTQEKHQLELYFHCGPFKIEIKVLNLKKAKTVKAWEYNTSYIPVCIIVPLKNKVIMAVIYP